MRTAKEFYDLRLKESGITVATAKACGLKALKPGVLEAGFTGTHRGNGVHIPYFDLDGKPLPGMRRVRQDYQTKYTQPEGSGVEAYYAPIIDWRAVMADAEVPVFITEGEFKAMRGCQEQLGVIGLGGVNSFRSSSSLLTMVDSLEAFTWAGRPVYIAYDSDAIAKPQVAHAENALCYLLSARGAKPSVIRLPELHGLVKTGLDDYLEREGVEGLSALIAHALPFAAARALLEMNTEVVYIKDPGLINIIANGTQISPQAYTNHAYSNRFYLEIVADAKGGIRRTEKSTAKEWLKWPYRATLERISYRPGHPKIDGEEYNSWTGWGAEPIPGDVTPWVALLDHFFHERPEERAWFESWCAYPLQNPGAKMSTAVLLWGVAEGTGKTLIGQTLARIYGKNASDIKNHDLSTSSRLEWAANKQFIMGDEVTGGAEHKRDLQDWLKALITQQTMRIDIKYVPAYSIPDCINWYFTSNHPDALYLSDNDRRFFVHEITNPPKPLAFYKGYREWMDGGGAAALFAHLLALPISADFEPTGRAPMTLGKRVMIDFGLSDLGKFITTLKTAPDSVLRLCGEAVPYALWMSDDLRALFDPLDRTRIGAQAVGREMKRAGFNFAGKGFPCLGHDGVQRRLWVVRPVEDNIWVEPKAAAELYLAERGL